MEKNSSRGNVLFLILIAVALFAALSYAVTSSSRGGGSNASSEKGVIGAGEIMDLFASYDAAVMRLKAGGCSSEQLDVSDMGAFPSMGRNFGNSNAPADGRCNIAKLTSTSAKISSAALDSQYAGRPSFGTIITHKNFGVTGVENNGNSGYVIIPYATDSVCLDINKRLFGISSIPISSATVNNYQPWDGTLQPGPGVIECNSSPLNDKKCGEEIGCFRVGTFSDFHESTNAATDSSDVNLVYHRLINAN